MKKRRFVWCFLAMLSTLCCSSGYVQAQEKEGEIYEFSEVVVTATKTERELKDLSTNVMIVTREDIERMQPSTLSDVLRFVPGLVINGGASDTSIYSVGFRGVSPSARGVLVLKDGIEMNNRTIRVTSWISSYSR